MCLRFGATAVIRWVTPVPCVQANYSHPEDLMITSHSPIQILASTSQMLAK